MKSSKINNSLLEGIVVICIMAIYIVYGISFFPLLIFIIPVPFVVLGVRHSLNANMLSLMLTLIIVQILMSSSYSFPLLLVFTPLTIVLNYSIKKRHNRLKTILLSALAFLIPLVVLIGFREKVSSIDLIKEAERTVTQILSIQLDAFKETGLTKYEMLKAGEFLRNIYNEILVLIPSFIALFSVSVAYINFAISTFVLRKLGYGVVSKGILSRFKLPNNIIQGIGVMFVTYFILRVLKVNYSEALLLNITFLVGIMFVFQGLAVLDFLLKSRNVKLLFRIIVLILMIVFIPISSIMFFIGIFDSMFDMRKIRRKKA